MDAAGKVAGGHVPVPHAEARVETRKFAGRAAGDDDANALRGFELGNGVPNIRFVEMCKNQLFIQ